MSDLKNLISIAPLPEDVKIQVINSLDTLSEDQKNELENLAWTSISEEMRDRIAADTQIAFMEAARGIKKPEEVDPDKIEEDIVNEYLTKIQAIDTSSQLDEIRQKLQAQPTTPK